MVAAVWFAAASMAGCNGASCQSACERYQSLGCGTTTAMCVSGCETLRSNAAQAGCGSQLQRLLNCYEENACNRSSSIMCRAQSDEFTGCSATFCVNNPTNTVCTNP